MSISIGDFDIPKGVVENRHRIMVLEKVIERLGSGQNLNQQAFNEIRKQAAEDLNEQYPGLGLEFNI